MRSGPSVTVAFTNPTFKGDFSFGKDQKSQRAKYGLGGGFVPPPPKEKSCRTGRRNDADSLLCSLRLCEFVTSANTTNK